MQNDFWKKPILWNKFHNWIKYGIWVTDEEYEIHINLQILAQNIFIVNKELKKLEKEYNKISDKRVAYARTIKKRIFSLKETLNRYSESQKELKRQLGKQ